MSSVQITITLPDGSRRQVPTGCTVQDALAQAGARLDQSILAAKVDGRPVDLSARLTKDAAIEAYTTGSFLPVNGGLTEEDLQYTIDFFTDAGVLEGDLTVEQAADLSYLEAVLEEIGRQ